MPNRRRDRSSTSIRHMLKELRAGLRQWRLQSAVNGERSTSRARATRTRQPRRTAGTSSIDDLDARSRTLRFQVRVLVYYYCLTRTHVRLRLRSARSPRNFSLRMRRVCARYQPASSSENSSEGNLMARARFSVSNLCQGSGPPSGIRLPPPSSLSVLLITSRSSPSPNRRTNSSTTCARLFQNIAERPKVKQRVTSNGRVNVASGIGSGRCAIIQHPTLDY